MGLRQALGRLAAALVPAAVVAAGAGCHGTGTAVSRYYHGLFAPAPAAHMGCMWTKEITHMPDPTRDGLLAPCMTGVMNLYDAGNLPTKADGDLQVMAFDETPRAAGQPAAMAEMWHFTAETLATKMACDKGNRGLPCYALFLPWPKEWKDVTKVRLQAKYTPRGGGQALTTIDPEMRFEFGPYPGLGNAQARGGPTEKRGIPDLKRTLAQVKGESVPGALASQPPVFPSVVPAATAQPAMMPQMPSSPAVVPVAAPAAMPVVVPADASPLPRPVPPPPPAKPVAVVVPITPSVPVTVAPATGPTAPPSVAVPVGEGLPAVVIPGVQ